MINVILLEDIKGTAPKGTILTVKDGFAFNYLFPKKLARSATITDMKTSKKLEEVREEERLERKKLIKKIKEIIKENEILFTLKGKAEGENLFAALHETDVSDMFKEKFGIELDPKKEVRLKEPLKTVGNHHVVIVIEGETLDAKVAIEAI